MTEPTDQERGAASATGLCIAVLGGTGPQGRGLALRFAKAGHRVVLGSRDADRAATLAAELIAGPGRGEATLQISGQANPEACRAADVVIVALPWAAHRDVLASLAADLAGKVVVDCVNPLGRDDAGVFGLTVPEGSAAQQAAALLPDSRVVAAFNHLSFVVLLDLDVAEVDADVLVLGDDRQATDLVADLAGDIPGVRGIYGGRLRNAGQVEAFTANLISINRRYKRHASLRITDV